VKMKVWKLPLLGLGKAFSWSKNNLFKILFKHELHEYFS